VPVMVRMCLTHAAQYAKKSDGIATHSQHHKDSPRHLMLGGYSLNAPQRL
jgi:hypothetical protein